MDAAGISEDELLVAVGQLFAFGLIDGDDHAWRRRCVDAWVKSIAIRDISEPRNSAPVLTDAEREAVEYFSKWCIGPSEKLARYKAALRSLLERLGGQSVNDTDRGDAEVARLRLQAAHAEIARLRLTDAERKAVETAMNAYGSDNANPECAAIEATLWVLLERTK